MKSFILHSNSTAREHIKSRLIGFINSLPVDKSFEVSIKPYQKRRSNDQNAYLWATYQDILEQSGEALAGWTKDDLHEYFLIEHFGHETLEGFGKKRLKPLKRSSKLTTVEFIDFTDFIKQRMAEFGIYVKDPNEEYSEG